MPKLRDLHPKLEGTIESGVLIHDCPVDGNAHRIRTPVSSQPFHEEDHDPPEFWPNGKPRRKKIWQATGEFPDTLTLSPSINIVEVDPDTGEAKRTLCWHGFVKNGEAN